MRVTSTLANPGNTERKACLRVHPAFQVTSTQSAVAWFARAGDKWEALPLANEKEPAAEKELWLREGNKPAGAWAWVDPDANIAVLDRFDPTQIGLCYLNWNGGEGRVNLELWSPDTVLKPGETMTVSHSYEVIQPASGWPVGR